MSRGFRFTTYYKQYICNHYWSGVITVYYPNGDRYRIFDDFDEMKKSINRSARLKK